MSNPSVRPRRSQAERTAATVAKLLESTIDSIVELGYAGATTRVICDRAGVSQGGLFRHFATRRELIVAAMEHLYESRRGALSAMLDHDLGGFDRERVSDQLALVREYVREMRNMAYLEVIMAARTEPDLRSALSAVLERQDRAVRAIALRSPLFRALSERSRRVWLDIANQTLWVDALWRTALPEPELDDPKLDALVTLAFLLASRDGVAVDS
jgi:AcrR family transcriptional regulator